MDSYFFNETISTSPEVSLMRQFQRHQKSETGVSVAPKMDMCPTKKLKTKNKKHFNYFFTF